jgi:Protein of unknown function (DUF3800)
LFTGYIDESGSPQSGLFTLSCLVGYGSMWQWVEWAWLNCLEKKNEQLAAQGRQQLSRYHAVYCSRRQKEYKDWSASEQIEFTGWLIKVFQRHPLVTISYTVDLRDLVEEFPEVDDKPYGLAHVLLLNHIMNFISEKLLSDPRYSKDWIALVHDRSDYNTVLSEAFKHMKNDSTFAHRERFTTIEPMGWENCIPLQPADLIAYENFKIVDMANLKKRRKSMELILDLDSFAGRGVKIERAGIKEIRDKLDEHSKQILFQNARISAKYLPQGRRKG